MFDYKQDIGLLHGSLQSAAYSKSGKLFDCGDIKDAVNIVHNSVKNIINYNLNGIKEEKEAIKRQLQINEKLHAAVFFTTLRSHGIISAAADTYYNSIVYSWPTMDLKFYIELNFKCDWSEYFIKCAAQLPSEIVHKVLKLVLDIPSSNHIKYYTWHLTLQTLILKLIEVPYDNEKSYPFNFDFATVEDNSVKDQIDNADVEKCDNVDPSRDGPDATSLLKEMFLNVSNFISLKLKESDGDAVVQILLHAVKTLLKSLITDPKIYCENVSQFVDFLKIYELLKDYLLTDANKGALKTALENCRCTVIYHSYASTSWNIPLNYLVFILDYYSNVLRSNSCVQFPELVYEKMINTSIYDTMKQLNSPFLHISSPKLHQWLEMLHKVIQFDFQGSTFAVKTILQSDPAIIEKCGILSVLVENRHIIDFKDQYKLLIDCIHQVKCPESKSRLLEVFYSLLIKNDTNIYDSVLSYILHVYGITDEFQLSDFNETFSQFTRKTPTLEEAEKSLPSLFVQNPTKIMKYLIDQALVQGSEGKVFIQLLSHFQQTCWYAENFNMPFLCYVLNQYFEKNKLEVYESKNMVTLYKFLAEVHEEAAILYCDPFFKCCIIPKLQTHHDNIYLILECVHAILPSLLSKRLDHNLELETVTSFISSLGEIIAYCIETGNGKLKSLVVLVLKELEIYQQESKKFTDEEKEKLWLSKFQYMNEMVCVYVKDFLPRNIDFSSKSFVWIWCCKNEKTYFFEEKFSCDMLSYPMLLTTLAEVLPHLTKEEWLYSLQLLKICCKNQHLKNEIFHSFNNLFHLSQAELDTYAAISCIITSLHFILNDRNCDPLYVSSCFSNCLMNLVNQEETIQTNMLITIFLDVCYLIQCVSPDLILVFTAALLEMKKLILDSCSVQTNEKHYKRLISVAVACLPDSCEKVILHQKLCK